MPEHRKRLKSLTFNSEGLSLWTLVWYLAKRSNLVVLAEKDLMNPLASYFSCETESPSRFTSNRWAGSIGLLVAGSTGRLTLACSAS